MAIGIDRFYHPRKSWLHRMVLRLFGGDPPVAVGTERRWNGEFAKEGRVRRPGIVQ